MTASVNLDFGKFPSDEDDRVLFMDWNGGDTPKGSTKVALVFYPCRILSCSP